MIGPCCTRDTFCQTIANTSANDLLDKGKFCQNRQIFKGADVLPQGRTSHDKLHSNAPHNRTIKWLFSGILFICARVVSFAARARSARAANDTSREQINNIPEKSHLIIIIINIQGQITSLTSLNIQIETNTFNELYMFNNTSTSRWNLVLWYTEAHVLYRYS